MKLALEESVLIVVLTVTTLSSVHGERFDGHIVLEVHTNSSRQLSQLQQLLIQYGPKVQHWRAGNGKDVGNHVYVSANISQEFKQALNNHHIKFNVLTEDVQKLIDEEAASNEIAGLPLPWQQESGARRRKRRLLGQGASIVGKYATFDEIRLWLYDIEKFFPDIMKVLSIGKTYEGRDILLVQIQFSDGEVTKPGLWLDGAHHAREWISPASVVYMIYKILSAYFLKTDELEIVRQVDWYIVPVLNADGYAFTYATDGNRLWRKNRSQHGDSSYSATYNLTCHGSDLNRNYPFNWGLADTATDPCIETYGGPSALSEIETQILTSYVLAHASSLQGFVTLHSYGQLFLTRWSYTNAIRPPDINDTLKVAQEAVEAIYNVNGVTYLAGIAPDLLYTFSGGAGDWARAKAGIKYSYEVELQDLGNYGFILPANYVTPVGEEIWAGMKVVVTSIVEEFPWKSTSNRRRRNASLWDILTNWVN